MLYNHPGGKLHDEKNSGFETPFFKSARTTHFKNFRINVNNNIPYRVSGEKDR